jgi:NitT/TauT family transport system substrate-binding protein
MRTRSLKAGLAAAALSLGVAGQAFAEIGDVKLSLQFGIGYLPLTIMKHDQLIEKHLAAAGLKDTKVSWTKFGSGSAANDALLSGNLHFAAGGTGPAFILWDRTQTNVGVRSVAALTSMPNLLITRNPDVKSLRDFTSKDRISLAGAGSSVQTMYLHMAAAKEFGAENYKKLNPLMVNLPHPEGLRALLSGQGEVTAQFTSPPFQYYALENPGIHTVLNSYDIMGGPNTFLVVWAAEKFRSQNPKTYKAVFDALKEATDSINANKARAAEVYVKEGGNRESPEKILKMMNDPQVRYSLTPERTLQFAEFMHQVGTLKTKPGSWKDLFFPEVHHLPGS